MNLESRVKEMKNIEINHSYLKENNQMSIKSVVNKSIEFMSLSIEIKDYRFLNTALKLNDLIYQECLDQALINKIKTLEEKALIQVERSLGLR